MSLPFLSTPPSRPCHFLGMSASFSMYVPFFRCESFPYISRRADWFPCSLFPFHSPCTPLVFISVPFMSLSVPLCFPFISPCFPVMSTSYFLAFRLCSPVFPATHGFSSVFAKRASKNTEFFPELAPRRLRLVERHQNTARYVGDPPFEYFHTCVYANTERENRKTTSMPYFEVPILDTLMLVDWPCA